MNCVFTIDVEDWFHILDIESAPLISEWEHMPSRVEANFLRLLNLVDERKGRCTCFFLGWIAERYPHLVREAVSRGHEIASHSYGHRLVYSMSPREFCKDAVTSRHIIEQIAGTRVNGYRAPGFSVTRDTPWFYDELLAAGYSYDASVFPASRGHGGLAGAFKLPQVVSKMAECRELIEIPQSVVSVAGRSLCFFGGGYLRLTPWPVICAMGERVMREGAPLIFYIHPRDIDADQPRLAMPVLRRFKSYVNLKSTEAKLRSVLQHFSVTSFEALLAEHRGAIAGRHVSDYVASGKG